MEKVSVIMPLFNAAKYLPEALKGILEQTYTDFELICINDCSTDDTAAILMDFQREDNRIKIMVNKERIGAGPSRNKGLKIAKGKYVIFLDGDDVFGNKLLETTCGMMDQYGTDVVLFDAMKHVRSENIHRKRTKEYSQEFVELYCEKPFCIHDFPARKFPLWSDSIGDKMFLKSFILDNRLEFQSLPSSNDVYFVRMALYCAGKVIWARSDEILLYTREHSEPSRISNGRDPMCACFAWEKLAEDLAERNMLQDVQEHFYITFASVLLNRLRAEKNKEKQKKFYLFLQNEGIEKCIGFKDVDLKKIDDYAMYILDGIQKSTYESGRFDVLDTCFQFYIKQKGEKICRFITEKLLQNKNIVLWGVGINGTALLEYLAEHSIRISGIVDRDERKQGTVVYEYVVIKPDFVYQEVDYILVVSQEVYWDVKSLVKNAGIEVVNLLDLLTEENR